MLQPLRLSEMPIGLLGICAENGGFRRHWVQSTADCGIGPVGDAPDQFRATAIYNRQDR